MYSSFREGTKYEGVVWSVTQIGRFYTRNAFPIFGGARLAEGPPTQAFRNLGLEIRHEPRRQKNLCLPMHALGITTNQCELINLSLSLSLLSSSLPLSASMCAHCRMDIITLAAAIPLLATKIRRTAWHRRDPVRRPVGESMWMNDTPWAYTYTCLVGTAQTEGTSTPSGSLYMGLYHL